MRALPFIALVACVPIEPSGQILEPVRERAPAPTATAPAPTPGPTGGFDFDAEDRDDEVGGGAEDPVDLQAKLLGVDPMPRPQPAPIATAPVAAGAPIPVWDPSVTLPEATFGVRVLATLLEMQPPRAVLGLPDGAERVVQPGAMLPEEGLVVLAIGRDAVQLAKVTPQGFYAAVRTETVPALYPNAADSP